MMSLTIAPWFRATSSSGSNGRTTLVLQFGVILTANCDILHQKHRGILSYVPLLAIEDYLRIFFFPSALRKGVKSIAEQLGRTLLADEVADAIRAYQAENLPDFPEPLSDSVALRWALTLTPEGLADELRITDPSPRKKFVTLVEDFRTVEAAATSEAYSAQWNALVSLRVRQGATAEKAREKIWSDIRASIKDLPGDRFFLGRIGSIVGKPASRIIGEGCLAEAAKRRRRTVAARSSLLSNSALYAIPAFLSLARTGKNGVHPRPHLDLRAACERLRDCHLHAGHGRQKPVRLYPAERH